MSEQQQASVAAEQVLASLEQKRAKCIQRGTDIADERAVLGYGAHVDNDKASRAKLDKLNAEAAVHASELASLDAAIREAGERLAAARHAEAIEADKANAVLLREAVQEFVECGVSLDEALQAIAEEGAALRDALNRIHVLGVPHPRAEQVNALVTNAILTALGQTPWKREFRTLAPRERRRMADLVRTWAANIEQNHIAPRLGEGQAVMVSDEVAA